MAEHDEVVDPDDPLDFLLADTDMTFSDCLAPHFGQAIFFSSDDEKIKCSHIFLHFLHLNSKIGIGFWSLNLCP